MNQLALAVLSAVILAFSQQSFAQDFDVYKRSKNDNFRLPEINRDMTFKEFQLLSRNLRMKDMLYAMVVPGYTHFYAKEPKTGYYTLGTRMLGYGGLTYVLANSENDVKWKDILGLQIDEADVKNGNNGTQNTITAISLTLIFGSYFFDWIHGKSVLEIKQEKIRFKYSLLKMSTYNQIHDNHVGGPDYIPLALFTISF